jgi:hypothetical protein
MSAVPAVIADTTPVLPMEALALPLVHAPPLIVDVSVEVEPWHKAVAPDKVPALGKAFTVTPFVALTLPQLLLTV